MKLGKEKLLQIQNLDFKMTIKLTDDQLNSILDRITIQQFIDYLGDDVEKSVDWICRFIEEYVDSDTLQQQIKDAFPPIQMKLFTD